MSVRTGSWLGAIAIAAAAIAVRVWLNHRDSDTAWQRVREGAAALPPLAAGEQPHAPLLGASRSGEAAACYVAAIESGPRDYNDASEADEVWQRVDGPLPGDAAELLAPYRPALDALAAGAACDRVDPATFAAPAWHAAAGKGTLLGGLVAFTIRHELAQGRPDAALQRTADLLTFARDQMLLGLGCHEMQGSKNVSLCCATWTGDTLAALPPPQLRTFAEVLQRLDAELPPARATDKECRLVVDIVMRDPPATGVEPHQLAAYVDAMRSLPAPDAAWPVRERALAKASRCLGEQHAAVMDLALLEYMRRAALAELRLLRMAIAHHLGEAMPPLPDPFGDGALTVTDDGAGGLRIASRGNATGIYQGEPLERRIRKD